MKPTTQLNQKIRGDSLEVESRRVSTLPSTDYNFQGSSFGNRGGRCFGPFRPSFRSISQDYFKKEARQSFAGEAALFVVIILTAALPILHSASALVQMCRSFSTV